MNLRILGGSILLAAFLGEPARGLEVRHQRLELAGAPAAIFTADVDCDGTADLVAVLVATDWGEIGVDESQRVDDAGAYVDVLTVVPALLDRRLLAVYRGLPGGAFEPTPWTLDLPDSVHALLPGPPAEPLLAWTDEGISSVVLADGALALVPALAGRSPLAGSASLLPDLKLTPDLDGDGMRDLLLPVEAGLEVHLATKGSLDPAAADLVPYALEERLPGDARHYRDGTRRQLPLPEALDLDGDHRPELVFREHERGLNGLRVARNLGQGRFAPAIDPLAGRPRDAEPEVVWLGDLDGDGRAELVTREELSGKEDSLRAGMEEARAPRARYAVHRIGSDLVWDPRPRRSFELTGHVFGGGGEALGLPAGISDLDGDGRTDLVALRLDLSMFQLLRVVAARSLRLGLDFQPYCQGADGSFRGVAGQDLGGKFTLRLDRLRLGQLASFAGDFDGDGRADFLQLGRGREASLRFGRPGCVFPQAGSVKLELAEEPADLALVRVIDLDGDRRSDLAITTPPAQGTVGGRGTLDLYIVIGGKAAR